MKPTITWILVADAETARLIESEGPGKGLHDVPGGEYHWDMPAGREIETDRPGRSFDSGGQGDAAGHGRHAMAPTTDPRRVEEQKFVRRVVDALEDAADRDSFDSLVLVASPRTLGELRDALPDRLRKKVSGELDKNLTHIRTLDLGEHLKDVASF